MPRAIHVDALARYTRVGATRLRNIASRYTFYVLRNITSRYTFYAYRACVVAREL